MFFFSSRRRHTRWPRDWSSDVCSSDPISIPVQGETVLGSDFATYPGGKGANQAVAAARMGAQVHLIGAVGDDSFGKSLVAHLQAEGIHTESITTVSDVTTGVANIILSEADNRIIVAPGADDFVLP